MIQCLNKVVNRIDVFQEDCSKMIFALRHILGEDQTINENDLYLKEDEDGIYVYRNQDLVLTYNEEGMTASPKYSSRSNLLKEAVKLVKNNIEEDGSPDKGVNWEGMGGKEGQIEEEDADLRSKVEKFLRQFPNPPDDMVHGLAKKLGVEPDKIEEIFYQIASEAINQDEDEVNENSVADVAVNPNAFEAKPKKRKIVKEASTTTAIVPKVDANTNQGDTVGSKKLTLQPAGIGNYKVANAVDQGKK